MLGLWAIREQQMQRAGGAHCLRLGRLCLTVDPVRHELHVDASRKVVALMAAVVIGAVIAAFVAGRNARHPLMISDVSTEELMARPVQPGVLDVGRQDVTATVDPGDPWPMLLDTKE